ncbi:MAG: HAD-IC family P-type ATPase, partial [Alphaproteobacteria bacterium]|nr:HAD-IC family P-type ATPase [Alphaproteobacteria bacterium]
MPDERTKNVPAVQDAQEPANGAGSAESGLTSAEAALRLATDGPNQLDQAPRDRLVMGFLSRFRNPLILILLGAAVGAALTGDPSSAAIISTIVLLSVLLDFIQEQRAQNAVDALRRHVALRATILRDGKPAEIPATEIVRGDVVLLRAGDLIPADCQLLEAKDLFVNEALLTGEAFPAEKQAGLPTDSKSTSVVPQNIVYMGSSVLSGTAKALVQHTGRTTQLGAITRSLTKPSPPTAFALGIRDFGQLIVRLTLLLVLFVLIVNLAFHRPLFESVLFALALAVGLTPELLPMIVSVTLARGALRMSAKKVIVKRLSAIHDLGSMDVLCADKTGTLTEAKITLVREVDITGTESDHVLELAYLNAAFETGLKSPLDDAILEFQHLDVAGWTKIDEVPFDFERRRVSVLLEQGGKRMLVVKGAPEDVLRLASRYQPSGNGPSVALDDEVRLAATTVVTKFGNDGFRLLGIAFRDVESTREHAQIGDEADLTFAGFAIFLDPPKESASTALQALRTLNVAIKIVTGDNEHITQHVCDALGIEVAGLLIGPEIRDLTDEALSARIETTTLFCRVTPSQKSRVLRAFRRNGHVVGFLGDGINDAP